MNKEKEKSADDDGVVFPFYPRQTEGVRKANKSYIEIYL